MHIQTREINTREQIAPLNEGALDLGLMRNTQLPDTLAWEVILREPLMAMIPNDHPLASRPAVSLAELAKSRLSFDPQVGTGLYDDILGLMRRYDLAPVITGSGRGDDHYRPVAAGLGVSILPASFKRVQLREMRWVAIAEEDAVSEMWLVWSKHREQSHAAQRFKQRLIQLPRSDISRKTGKMCGKSQG